MNDYIGLNKKIEKLREKLNMMIIEDADSEKIMAASEELDTLISKYNELEKNPENRKRFKQFDPYIFGQNLSGLLEKSKLTQELFAEKINISVSYVGLLCRGNRKPSLDTLIDISDFFSIPIDDLLFSKGVEKEISSYTSDLIISAEPQIKEFLYKVYLIVQTIPNLTDEDLIFICNMVMEYNKLKR